MKKKLLAIFGAIASLALLAGCQTTEEPQHTHTWATEWTTDGTHHWKECTDESCEEVHEKTAHSGGTATCIAEKECEVCGEAYGEKAEHVWDNVCDTECNTDGCGETRTVEHVWDNVCDTECNTDGCGETRTVEHVYDSVCDGECNTEGCGETRTPEAHVWTNVCDTTCDNDGCQETRTVEHVWDNACDTECNTEGCGETREIQHDFATTAFYTKATTMQAGAYAIVTGSNAAKAVPAENTYGYLKVEAMAEKAATLASPATDILFVFAQVEGGYTIQDVNGRYLYMSGNYNNVNVSATLPSEGHVWTVAIDGEGAAAIVNVLKGKTMQWDPEFKTYGIYANVDKALPALYAVSGTNLESDGTDHWTTCTICGAGSEKTAHSGGTATCETKKECEVCGTSYGDFADHDYVKQNKDDTHHWMECACGTVDEDTKVAHECEWVTTNAKYDFYVCECGHVGAEFKKSLSVLRQELLMTGSTFSIVLDGVSEYASVESIMLGDYDLGTDLAALTVSEDLQKDTQSHGDQTIVVTVVDENDVQHAISVPVRLITKSITTAQEFNDTLTFAEGATESIFGYYVLGGDINMTTLETVKQGGITWSGGNGFKGTLDGNGHTVTTNTSKWTHGLFGTLHNATIKNVKFVDGWNNQACMLAYNAYNTTFENVEITINNGNPYTGTAADGKAPIIGFNADTVVFKNVTITTKVAESVIFANTPKCTYENVVVNGDVTAFSFTQAEFPTGGSTSTAETVAFKETQLIDLSNDASAIDLKEYADADLVSIKTASGFDFNGLKAVYAPSTLKTTLSAHGETTITVTVITADEKVVEITIPVIIATKTISTMTDLQAAVKGAAKADAIYGCYVLTADVSDTEEGFTKINASYNYDWYSGTNGFRGTLIGATREDGKKYTISFKASNMVHGLFTTVRGATIKNVKFVTTDHNVGWSSSIIGYTAYQTTFEDVEFVASVTEMYADDTSAKGLIVGSHMGGCTFKNVSFTCNEAVRYLFLNINDNAATLGEDTFDNFNATVLTGVFSKTTATAPTGATLTQTGLTE